MAQHPKQTPTNNNDNKSSKAVKKQLIRDGLKEDPASFVKKSLLDKRIDPFQADLSPLAAAFTANEKERLLKEGKGKIGFKRAYQEENEILKNEEIVLNKEKNKFKVFYDEGEDELFKKNEKDIDKTIKDLQKRKLDEETIKKLREGTFLKRQFKENHLNQDEKTIKMIKDILTPIKNVPKKESSLDNEKNKKKSQKNGNFHNFKLNGPKDELGKYNKKNEDIDQELEIEKILDDKEFKLENEPDIIDEDPFAVEKTKPLPSDLSNDNTYKLLSIYFASSALLRKGGDDLVIWATEWYKAKGNAYLSNLIFSFPDLANLIAVSEREIFKMKEGIFIKIEKHQFVTFLIHNFSLVFLEIIRILRKNPSLWFMAQQIEKRYKAYINDEKLPSHSINHLLSLLNRSSFKNDLNKKFGYLPMQNYVLDLENNDFSMIKYIDCPFPFDWKLNYDLLKDIDTSRVERLVSDMLPDEESRNWLMALLGNAMSGKLPPPYCIFFYGLGRNGKSVLCELIKHTFGNKIYVLPSEYLSKANLNLEGPSPLLLGLEKKTIAIIPEIEKKKIDTSRLKTLIDGNDITGRNLRSGINKEFICQSLFLIQANCFHTFSNDDKASRRRLVIVKFENTFLSDPNPENPNEKPSIPNLKYSLRNDLSWRQEFLWYLIKSKGSESSERLPIPKKVFNDTLKANRQNEPITPWLLRNIEFSNDCCVQRMDIINRFLGTNYQQYQEVPNYQGYKREIDDFFIYCEKENLVDVLIVERRKMFNGRRIRAFFGAKLKEEEI